jgi:hypothetical protein
MKYKIKKENKNAIMKHEMLFLLQKFLTILQEQKDKGVGDSEEINSTIQYIEDRVRFFEDNNCLEKTEKALSSTQKKKFKKMIKDSK